MYPLLIFLSINLFLYSWLSTFHQLVQFSKFEYQSSNHYIADPRVSGKDFSLINSLAQYDSQWYIKIADKGYPDHPTTKLKLSTQMGILSYNFFPLFPLTIAFFNFFIRNILISAFIASNLLLLASSYSLFFVVSKWFSKQVALKSLCLMLLFPFSIFLRGYYSEDLRLLLFIWFCYGLTQKKFLLAAFSVGLLCVTSGISLLLLPFFYGMLLVYRKKLAMKKMLLSALVAVIPLALWMVFCWVHTGDPLLFVHTRFAWERPTIFPLLYNILLIFSVVWLPVRAMYASRLDVLWMLIVLGITFLSMRILPRVVWLATIVLTFTPLLVQDSVSFIRFSSVLFPFFVFLAVTLKKKYYIMLLCFFTIVFLLSSLYYINWYWIE